MQSGAHGLVLPLLRNQLLPSTRAPTGDPETLDVVQCGSEQGTAPVSSAAAQVPMWDGAPPHPTPFLVMPTHGQCCASNIKHPLLAAPQAQRWGSGHPCAPHGTRTSLQPSSVACGAVWSGLLRSKGACGRRWATHTFHAFLNMGMASESSVLKLATRQRGMGLEGRLPVFWGGCLPVL